jgi:hypothetical protein
VSLVRLPLPEAARVFRETGVSTVVVAAVFDGSWSVVVSRSFPLPFVLDFCFAACERVLERKVLLSSGWSCGSCWWELVASVLWICSKSI